MMHVFKCKCLIFTSHVNHTERQLIASTGISLVSVSINIEPLGSRRNASSCSFIVNEKREQMCKIYAIYLHSLKISYRYHYTSLPCQFALTKRNKSCGTRQFAFSLFFSFSLSFPFLLSRSHLEIPCLY